ncbi:hypothetical protein BOTBODRAFT_25994 [Botryobasidium botryosum FD-172 SS1]|uniref:Uncharacterized protein n=1 Tax=Botryobasidium botryosum (strain FD-172 SS1) TaxID=930990 RepID=A0A067NCN5_BOTB1|nr:hypothetical protein BOTBODRAFT_25994 [Botryobasidium botryosum FD-172 SS1]
MSTARDLQKRVHRPAHDAANANGASAAPTPSLGLSIDIPKPHPIRPTLLKAVNGVSDGDDSRLSPLPNGNGHSDQATNGSAHEDEEEYATYRERLISIQGSDYTSVEQYRLEQDGRKDRHWKRWGPYLAERQWATVREDYSADGDAWSHFPHTHSRSRAYRWGEDGIGGISDNHQRLCFALGLWNGVDPILKERLFGVTGHEGNHGEDCKELYYYLDSTPTHSYMKFLYKYPQRPYPYEELVRETNARGREVSEYEILDTDAFDDNRYWDVFVEYAKDDDYENGMSIRITAFNRGPEPATLHILPHLWFPNTWSWPLPRPAKPTLREAAPGVIKAQHETLGTTHLYCLPSPPPVAPEAGAIEVEGDSIVPDLLFTENETNYERLWGGKNDSPYAKDAFHDHIIPEHRPKTAGDATPTPPRQYVNPNKTGTKSAAHYVFRDVPANGGCAVVRVKMTPRTPREDETIDDDELFDNTIDERRAEADEFYGRLNSGPVSDDLRSITRQALAGMLWSKQYYQFIQDEWIKGDPAQPPPPPGRKYIRNKDWRHLHIADILSMPDKWEYPFFAAWDTAFHCIPLALVDPAFAKKQLDLLTREWYMKPDGQIPAYEWNFSDVNPPVHAWATFRVFKIERKLTGKGDIQFLERVFQKLLLNFTWWVNRKDQDGNNVFEGGFLGLDNIGLFNRSEPLPTGGQLRQADGTAWMGFFCLNMLNMALELSKTNPTYEDIASKFFEHFIFIADAMTFKGTGDNEASLWNEEDGFYYDAIQWDSGYTMQLPVRSLVGLIPLYATLTLEPDVVNRLPGFKKRMDWFIHHRSEMAQRNMANMKAAGKGNRILLALASKERLVRILERMLDESEFLSDHGIRSMSLYHKDHPYGMDVHGQHFGVEYWPGDSKSGMFGGNSNWRGPIWLAVNFLLIESLQRFYQYYGDELQVECPTGSGDYMNLANVAEEIQHRIIHIFGKDMEGRRATNGGSKKLDRDPFFRDYVLFHEFFHGNDGRGLGASHQTGWTGLVAFSILQSGMSCRLPRTPRTPRSTSLHYFDEHIPASARGDMSVAAESGLNSAYPGSEYSLGDLSTEML